MAGARTFGLIVVLIGAVLVGNWLAGEREPEWAAKPGRDAGDGPAAGAETAAPADKADRAERGPPVGEEVAPARRDVTPPGVLPGPPGAGPMVRVPGYVPPVRPPRPEVRRYPRVVVESAGSFIAEDVRVRFAGVDTLPAERVCADDAGATWPCGRAGRSALRRLIRARLVDCDAAPGTPTSDYEAYCRVGAIDINRWLVEQGWARPVAGAPADYGPLAKEAERAGRGIYRKVAPSLPEASPPLQRPVSPAFQ